MTEWQPGERMSYELLDGMNARGYHATASLEDAPGGGTIVRWSSPWESADPITAFLLRTAAKDTVKRLANAAAPSGGRSARRRAPTTLRRRQMPQGELEGRGWGPIHLRCDPNRCARWASPSSRCSSPGSRRCATDPSSRRTRSKRCASAWPHNRRAARGTSTELLRVLDEDVLPFVGHFDHPRFFGYIPGAGTWPAALGDLIAAATMIDAGSWREAAGPSALELTVLDWFRDWVEYPESAAGVLVSGGSAANLTAIACAREALIGPMSPRIVMYTGDQTHSSVARAARHLGFRPDQLRVLPTDDDFRLRPADVIAAIDADLAANSLPLFVSANAGTTNSGAVDPIGELADACHERGVWLHVDGAYGAFAVLTDRGKRAMRGMNQADSITLDPHKWLAMPFEVGCLLVREGRLLEQAFELHPEYLKEGHKAGVNFADRGLQLTRASRAIKVWLAIGTVGLDAFRRRSTAPSTRRWRRKLGSRPIRGWSS